MILHTKQRQHLKKLAHSLKPIVMLGHNGLTKNVLTEIKCSLEHHEIIKVKIITEEREAKHLAIAEIVKKIGAAHVQTIGKIVVLYRPSKKCKISLPR